MKRSVKRAGLFPKLRNKSVNNFFDDFTTLDLSDLTDKNFAALDSKVSSENLKETYSDIEVESAAPGKKREDFKVEIDDNPLIIFSEKEDVRKKDNYNIREFSYRSFCRLPNL